MTRYLLTQHSPRSSQRVLVGIELIDPKLERSVVWQCLVEEQALEAKKKSSQQQTRHE